VDNCHPSDAGVAESYPQFFEESYPHAVCKVGRKDQPSSALRHAFKPDFTQNLVVLKDIFFAKHLTRHGRKMLEKRVFKHFLIHEMYFLLFF
jgi:hypothetical protein